MRVGRYRFMMIFDWVHQTLPVPQLQPDSTSSHISVSTACQTEKLLGQWGWKAIGPGKFKGFKVVFFPIFVRVAPNSL